jgi:DNA invertase Pin-like site-specific DNA recombinase
VVPLHTDSLAIANRDKHKHVHALKQRIAEAELELSRVDRAKGKTSAVDPLVAEGLDWRQSFKDDTEDYYASTALEARWEEVAKAQGEERADMLAEIATGRATPLGPMADQWLEAKTLKPRQRMDYRRGVAKLEAWLLTKSLSPAIEATTRRIASDYRDSFVKAGSHPKTASKDISILSGLWGYAERQGMVEVNVWRGLSFPKAGATGSARKRPVSDPELATILASSAPSPVLRDAVVLLALGGMRCEELARMRTSTVTQEAGLEAQERDLKAAGVEKLFTEQVSSVAQREELEAALDYVRNGDVLVVTKLDRLARSIRDLCNIVDRLTAKGVSLRILGMGLDTATANGRLMLNVLGSVAQFEREVMLERQREGIAKAKSEGKFKGRAPTARRKADEVKAMAGAGMTREAIAGKLGMSERSVYRVLAA